MGWPLYHPLRGKISFFRCSDSTTNMCVAFDVGGYECSHWLSLSEFPTVLTMRDSEANYYYMCILARCASSHLYAFCNMSVLVEKSSNLKTSMCWEQLLNQHFQVSS